MDSFLLHPLPDHQAYHVLLLLLLLQLPPMSPFNQLAADLDRRCPVIHL
jgi:hypothetical protein